jgi:uncharacterized phage protein (TIGR01671 family)
MREIKFRVWDNVDYMSSPFTLSDIVCKRIEFASSCPIMQYTGIKDKNNTGIYEGDILKVHVGHQKNQETVFEVFFDTGAFQMRSPHYAGRTAFITFATNCFENIPEFIDVDDIQLYLEVIGNIYQNPELLKPAA